MRIKKSKLNRLIQNKKMVTATPFDLDLNLKYAEERRKTVKPLRVYPVLLEHQNELMRARIGMT